MMFDATLTQPHDHVLAREKILADALKDVATELRLIDVGDLIAFIKTGQFANIQDLVNSSVELYFKPGTLTYAWAADLDVTWTEPPAIMLDMELRSLGTTVFFSLALRPASASIDIRDVFFDHPVEDAEVNTRLLAAAIEAARVG